MAMQEPMMMASHSGGGSGGIVIGIIVLLVAAIGGYFYMQTNKDKAQAAQASAATAAQAATAQAASTAAKAKAEAEEAEEKTKQQQQTQEGRMRAYAMCQMKEKAYPTIAGLSHGMAGYGGGSQVTVGSCTQPSTGKVYMKCTDGYYGNNCSQKCPTAESGFNVAKRPFKYKSGYALGAPASEVATCECMSEYHFANTNPQAPAAQNSCMVTANNCPSLCGVEKAAGCNTSCTGCAPNWFGSDCKIAANTKGSNACSSENVLNATGGSIAKTSTDYYAGLSGYMDVNTQTCECTNPAQWTGAECDTRPTGYCSKAGDSGATYDATTKACKCSDGFMQVCNGVTTTGAPNCSAPDQPCQPITSSSSSSSSTEGTGYTYKDGVATKWTDTWTDVQQSGTKYVNIDAADNWDGIGWGGVTCKNVGSSACENKVNLCNMLEQQEPSGLAGTPVPGCTNLAALCNNGSVATISASANNQATVAFCSLYSQQGINQPHMGKITMPVGTVAQFWQGTSSTELSPSACLPGESTSAETPYSGGSYSATTTNYRQSILTGLAVGQYAKCGTKIFFGPAKPEAYDLQTDSDAHKTMDGYTLVPTYNVTPAPP